MRRARGYGSAAACLIAGLVAVGSPAAAQQGGAQRPTVVGPSAGVDVHSFAGGAYLVPKGVTLSPDRVLVRFKASAGPRARAQATSAAGASLVHRLSLVPGLQLIETAPGKAVEAAAKLARDPAVAYATPDVLVPVQATPNDPQFGQLWGMTSIGAPAAWNRSTGSASIRVGVLDTGIAVAHPDLAANVWTNDDPVNGVDDDNNGYIDDVHGWDFQAGDNDPADVFGHGTHVAGTIGAVGNNAVGVTGVNWTVTLLPLKVCGDTGLCSLSAEIEALQYAIANDVKVVNASFGGPYGGLPAEEDAIEAAGAAGILYVSSAGNAANDNDLTGFYPASYPLDNVVSVAATAADDSLAPFSNYGLTSVDLGAPGVDILSTIPGGTGYGQNSGTSMASPHVAGAAALLWSVNPGWTMQQIRTRLLATVRGASSMAGKVGGCGILDVDAATNSGVTTNGRLCVDLLGTGDGTVTSTPSGIDCGASCAGVFTPGTNVALTATPAAGSTFAGWSGACAGTGACSVNVASVAAVRATFNTPGTPPGWTQGLLAPPAARAPTLPKTEPGLSFFNVALSADGQTRAKTIFNARELNGALVSCFYDSTDTGGVYLEREVAGVWTADGAITAPAVGSDGSARWANCGWFGSTTELSADGSTLLVAQDMVGVSGGYRCAAFVYHRTAANDWDLQGTLFPPGIGAGGSPTWEGCRYFGIGGAISDDGNRVAILSFQHADVFVRTAGVWSLEQRVDDPAAIGDGIGPRQIALSGDGATLLVSAPDNNFSGTVHAFGRTGSTWSATQTIPSPEACASGRCGFGSSIALSTDGQTAAMSVQRVNGLPDFAGAVWAFEHDGTGWHARRKLTAPQEGGFTCPDIVRDGRRFVCGANERVGRNPRQGALYVFDRIGSSWANGSRSTRAFVGNGLSFDGLGQAGFLRWASFGASADGRIVDATIAPENIVQGRYGQDRLGYSFTVPVPSFADVPPANPFYDNIERLFELGITTGCGTNGFAELIYCPTDPVPRQQMAAFLIRAKGLTQLFPATPSFVDVPPSNPFFGYIERLKEQGITTGCNPPTNDRFCPGEFVPRQQMAAFLIRAKGLTQLFPATPSFVDVPASNPFFGYIERLKEQGITTGCNPPTNNLYCPLKNVPRQQMAAFLIRAFDSP